VRFGAEESLCEAKEISVKETGGNRKEMQEHDFGSYDH
jgi:hypothetical protein